jgi:mRNA interferase HigB
MRVISRKILRQFWHEHPDSEMALARWYKLIEQTNFKSFAELRTIFPTADLVDRWIVFIIGGNKVRLITSAHFNRNRIYIRHVLTHQEYDKGSWKK